VLSFDSVQLYIFVHATAVAANLYQVDTGYIYNCFIY